MIKRLLTISQYNSLRAKRRWQGISKKDRSIAMKEVAVKGWITRRKKLSTDSLAI